MSRQTNKNKVMPYIFLIIFKFYSPGLELTFSVLKCQKNK